VIGTVDELLADDIVDLSCFRGDNGIEFDAVIVVGADRVDEPSTAALLQFKLSKLLLLGDSQESRDPISSLFRRMVRKYEKANSDLKLTSESKCSVVSKYCPLRRKRPETEEVKKPIVWYEDLTKETDCDSRLVIEPEEEAATDRKPNLFNGDPDTREFPSTSSGYSGSNSGTPQKRPGPASKTNSPRRKPGPKSKMKTLQNGVLRQPVPRKKSDSD